MEESTYQAILLRVEQIQKMLDEAFDHDHSAHIRVSITEWRTASNHMLHAIQPTLPAAQPELPTLPQVTHDVMSTIKSLLNTDLSMTQPTVSRPTSRLSQVLDAVNSANPQPVPVMPVLAGVYLTTSELQQLVNDENQYAQTVISFYQTNSAVHTDEEVYHHCAVLEQIADELRWRDESIRSLQYYNEAVCFLERITNRIQVSKDLAYGVVHEQISYSHEDIEKVVQLSKLYATVSEVFAEQEEPDKAIEYYNKAFANAIWALRLCCAAEDIRNLDQILWVVRDYMLPSAAVEYEIIEQFISETIQVCEQIEEIDEDDEDVDKIEQLSKLYKTIGNIYYEQEDPENTTVHYTKAISSAIRVVQLRGAEDDIEQLKEVLVSIDTEMYRAEGKYEILEQYISEAIQVCEQIEEIDEDVDKIVQLGNLYKTISDIYNKQADTYKALEYFSKNLQWTRRLVELRGDSEDYDSLVKTLEHIGDIYKTNSDMDAALVYYEEAISVGEQLVSQEEDADVIENIGLQYYALGVMFEDQADTDKALEYFSKDLQWTRRLVELRGDSEDYDSLVKTLEHIGDIYKANSDTDAALVYYEEAISVGEQLVSQEEDADVIENICKMYYALGAMFEDQADTDKALEYFSKDLQWTRRLVELRGDSEDLYGLRRTLVRIGNIYINQNNTEMAVKYWSDAADVCKKIINIDEKVKDVNWLMETYLNISIRMEKIRKLAEALTYSDHAVKLSKRAIQLGSDKHDTAYYEELMKRNRRLRRLVG